MSFVVLGIFNTYTVYAVFVVEVIIVFTFFYRFFNVTVDSLITVNDSDNKYCLALIAGLLYYCAVLAGNQLITKPVFLKWDAIVSWNRWAVSFYHGKIPTVTYGYPQLLPINWSITYQFMNSADVQFFAKSIMPLFTLHMLLLCVDLFRRSRRFGYLLSVPFILFLIHEFMRNYIFSGYADLAVAYFAFNAVCSILYAQYENDRQTINKFVSLGGLFAIGSAMIKFNGLFVIGIYPVLAYIIVLRKDFALMECLPFVFQYIVMVSITVFPWYIYTTVQISSGKEVDISKQLAFDRIKGGEDRLSVALKILHCRLTLALGAFAVLFNRALRWSVLLIAVPFTMLYIYVGVSKPRYLSVAYPIYGMAAGIGIEELFILIKKRMLGRKTSKSLYAMINFQKLLPRFRGIKVYHVLIVFVLMIGGLGFANPRSELIAKQIYYKKQIVNRRLNMMLYDYFNNRELKGKILTSYLPLKYLPGFENRYVKQDFNYRARNDAYSAYLKDIKKPEIKYLLLYKDTLQEVPTIYWDLTYRIKTGSFRPVKKGHGYVLIEIVDRN